MEAGDKFVYFTKYGGVVKGEVVEVNLTDTTSMLEMVWTAVVEFIEYLNKQI